MKYHKTKEEVLILERVLSSEERIRRAEEIYQRRKTQSDRGIRVSTSSVNTNINTKMKYKLFKKLILQIFICLLIYLTFYLIKNSNYIFSEDVLSKTREFLSYDVNFDNIYFKIEDFYNTNIKSLFNVNQSNSNNENSDNETKEIQENQDTINEESVNTDADIIGIGGGEEGIELLENEVKETSADEEIVQMSQMEIDAKDIRENYNFILPLQGIISSRFGPRTPTDIVSANHAGIDIAANSGTQFIAAMEGNVTYVSSEGGYGNHVYIENGDVTTLYAHCKTIYVKEGEKITQGQLIGEVGSTGNATGPHLHFEVRKEDRVVNPEYILSFD